jgi:hypothetical protein
MNFAYIIYLDMRIVELMIWQRGASGYNVQSKNFHVKAKLMLGGEEILLYIEPDGLTAMQATQTTTQASRTARTQGGQ